MALIRANTHSIPVLFAVGDDGYAMVTPMNRGLRFQFQEESLYIVEEVLDSETSMVAHALRQFSFRNEEGKLWMLKHRNHRAYGLSDSLLGASTETLTPRESSMCTIETPTLPKAIVEPRLPTIHELSDK